MGVDLAVDNLKFDGCGLLCGHLYLMGLAFNMDILI